MGSGAIALLSVVLIAGCGANNENNGTSNNGSNNGGSNNGGSGTNNGTANNGGANNGAANNGVGPAFSCSGYDTIGNVTVPAGQTVSWDGRKGRFYSLTNCSVVSQTMQVQPVWGWEDRLEEDQSLSSGNLLLGFVDGRMEADPGTYTVIPQPTSNDEYDQVDKVYGVAAIGEPDGSPPNTFYKAVAGTVTISESEGENEGEVCKRFDIEGMTFEAASDGATVTADATFACLLYR